MTARTVRRRLAAQDGFTLSELLLAMIMLGLVSSLLFAFIGFGFAAVRPAELAAGPHG